MFAHLIQPGRRDFSSLDEREILSLAVAAEEEDGAIYAEIAERLTGRYPATAKVFEGMAAAFRNGAADIEHDCAQRGGSRRDVR